MKMNVAVAMKSSKDNESSAENDRSLPQSRCAGSSNPIVLYFHGFLCLMYVVY